MDNWFTVEEISKDTFAISEYHHWEETHCYLLLGTKRAILIDTGLGVGNIRTVVDSLTCLPVTVITTHVHWDHIGGHFHFGKFEVHKHEREWLSVKFPIPLQVVKHNLTCKPCAFPKDFSLDEYQIFHGTPTGLFTDGDTFDLGGRTLVTVHTPGHSPGHCCFYEPERKWLYSGDLIYAGCLDAFYPTTDPQLFYQSLRKVQRLDVRKLLPAHHRLDIPADMTDKITQGFESLESQGLLRQGNGIFEFEGFQIHI